MTDNSTSTGVNIVQFISDTYAKDEHGFVRLRDIGRRVEEYTGKPAWHANILSLCNYLFDAEYFSDNTDEFVKGIRLA